MNSIQRIYSALRERYPLDEDWAIAVMKRLMKGEISHDNDPVT